MSKHESAAAETRPPETAAETEARLRREIAMCTRLLNMQDIIEYSGHISARLPDGEHFLVQDVEKSRATLKPSDLLVCDLDGRAERTDKKQRPPSEIFIHSEIYKARPDVHAIAHFHHDPSILFTLVKGMPVVPIKNHAIRWRSGIPVHRNPAHVDTTELGQQLATTLGKHEALLIRAHGQVVVAEDCKSLLVDCIHLVENCAALYQASQLGREVEPLSAQEMDDFAATFNRGRHARKLWTYYVGQGKDKGIIDDLL
jgi:L-ribulose-5-phosphate 4-epimerase